MKDGDGRKGTRQDDHRIKKPSGWPDYFDWMVRYAQKLVGRNDARAVANEALHDAYRTERQKPSVENEEEARRWLSCLIIWRARAHRKREQRQKTWEACDIEAQADLYQFVVPGHSDVVLDRIEIMRALQELSSEERTLVMAYYVGGFSATELGAKYEMNESTVRTRIARATAKLVESFRRRREKPRVWRGITFFMDPLGFGRFGRNLVDSVRDGLWNLLRLARPMATCASGLVVSGFMPGDVSEIQEWMNTAPPVQPGEPPAMDGVRVFPSIVPNAYAMPDQRVSEKLPRVMTDKPHAVPAPPETDHAPIHQEVPAIDLGPTLPDPYGRSTNPEEACSNAYAKAQTAFNIHGHATECSRYLDQLPANGERCRETEERSRLRRDCLAKLTK